MLFSKKGLCQNIKKDSIPNGFVLSFGGGGQQPFGTLNNRFTIGGCLNFKGLYRTKTNVFIVSCVLFLSWKFVVMMCRLYCCATLIRWCGDSFWREKTILSFCFIFLSTTSSILKVELCKLQFSRPGLLCFVLLQHRPRRVAGCDIEHVDL